MSRSMPNGSISRGLTIPKTVATTRGYPFGGDGTTGISNTTSDIQNDDVFYNLNGQRVAAPSKGMFIRNNKKVVIK